MVKACIEKWIGSPAGALNLQHTHQIKVVRNHVIQKQAISSIDLLKV